MHSDPGIVDQCLLAEHVSQPLFLGALQVRLQELLGSTDMPVVARNAVPLQLELLSPAFRPVQRTQDLQSFWQAGYKSVRKELRAKYPKHFWPEDPMSCEPIKGSMEPKKKRA